MVGLLGIVWHLIVYSFSDFWQTKDQSFAALVGILVALNFDDVFLHVSVSFINVYVFHFPSLFFGN